MSQKVKLPNEFSLPAPEEYDASIANVWAESVADGGAMFYLGRKRHARRNSREFYYDVLEPLAEQALSFEPKNNTSMSIDRHHRIANAALSGMLFGTYVNDALYPELEHARPYKKFVLNGVVLGDATQAYEQAIKQNRVKGFTMAAKAMSAHVLAAVDEKSIEGINALSGELILEDVARPYFHVGFGMTLHSARITYAALVVERNGGSPAGFMLSHAQNRD